MAFGEHLLDGDQLLESSEFEVGGDHEGQDPSWAARGRNKRGVQRQSQPACWGLTPGTGATAASRRRERMWGERSWVDHAQRRVNSGGSSLRVLG